MAFIVKKKISGKDYYYLRESKREGKKVKSIFLAYLGKDKKEAEKKMKEILEKRESGLKVPETRDPTPSQIFETRPNVKSLAHPSESLKHIEAVDQKQEKILQ